MFDITTSKLMTTLSLSVIGAIAGKAATIALEAGLEHPQVQKFVKRTLNKLEDKEVDVKQLTEADVKKYIEEFIQKDVDYKEAFEALKKDKEVNVLTDINKSTLILEDIEVKDTQNASTISILSGISGSNVKLKNLKVG